MVARVTKEIVYPLRALVAISEAIQPNDGGWVHNSCVSKASGIRLYLQSPIARETDPAEWDSTGNH